MNEAAAHSPATVADAGAASAVVMPPLAAGGASLVRWWVRAGQAVAEGDVLAEIAAGNATMELEAAAAGTVTELLVPAGPDIFAVGTHLASIAPIVAAEPASDARDSDFEAVPVILAQANENARLDAATDPTTVMTYTEALRTALAEEMRRDPDVFLIGETVADFGRSSGVARGVLDEFGPMRAIGTPVTPAGFTGLAIGAAMAGLRPVVEYRGWSLALQAIDHIVSTAAKTRYRTGGALSVPIVLRGLNGAWPGTGAMHSVSFAAWLAHVPGLKVVCPATPACAKGLLKAAIRDPDPVIVLETEALYDVSGPVPDSTDFVEPIGRARVARHGDSLTIVSYGRGVAVAQQAAETLARQGIEAEVVDLRSLRPLDLPCVIASVRKTRHLLTLDDDWPLASIGSEICAAVTEAAFADLDAAPVRLHAADAPTPFASNLEALVWPDADHVATRARQLAAIRHR